MPPESILSLPGAPALSAFRLRKRHAALRQRFPAAAGLDSRFVHLVELSRPLTDTENGILARLLDYGVRAPVRDPAAATWLVVPRFGTVSPWSSKATDIAHVCGLDAVLRIERGIAYFVESPQAASFDPGVMLHDRMTETLVSGLDEARALFRHAEPARGETVGVLGGGRKALVAANRDLGLALSDAEIDYLCAHYAQAGRDATDTELMMFAQANSEHCRHKIFNASWRIDGEEQDKSLFAMIRNTHAKSPAGVLSAYVDNAAVIAGSDAQHFAADPRTGIYGRQAEPAHILLKVETHNHPTAISPFPGAATGSGGEIRDEGATGRGARPKAGLTGFSVSDLRIPGFCQPWEKDNGKPSRIASALSIMLEGPVGGASFNNEFGRPNLAGYFRSFEQRASDSVLRGYHKPIMVAGGMGNVRPPFVLKAHAGPGALIVVLGGPAMLIGLGGGAASSMSSGQSMETLDYASVQRGNAEMQRRAQEVIDRCCELGADNPVILIHDVGAGGLSNAVPELIDHSGLGGRVELRDIPNEEPGMAPMAIWCNEAQERYVLALAPADRDRFAQLCARERCPFAVIGEMTAERRLIVSDRRFGDCPVDMPMGVLFGKPPRLHREDARRPSTGTAFATEGIEIGVALERVLRVPAVAAKDFLITIGDRSVGGRTCRDQMVGRWQVPVADVAVTAADFDGYAGEAMAMGERTPLALLSGPASGRMAVAEALTNIAAADVRATGDIRLSANWMAASGHPGEEAALYDTVHALGEAFCPALGIAIPVGKDSLSLRSDWEEDGEKRAVVAPLSLIVSAFAPVTDVRATWTPELHSSEGDTEIWLVDLGAGRDRLGASCLAQAWGVTGEVGPDIEDPGHLAAFLAALRVLRADGLVLAYHDRSDGGAIVCLLEMAFAGGCGLDVFVPEGRDPLAMLFAEEAGALLQVRTEDRERFVGVFKQHGLQALCTSLAQPLAGDTVRVSQSGRPLLVDKRSRLHGLWSETSYQLARLRDDPDCADEAFAGVQDPDAPGLIARLEFDPGEDVSAPFLNLARPRLTVLREQGVNSHYEMAAAFDRAGFECVDVHMSDIIAGNIDLSQSAGLAVCGGFSFGDVLGGGEGWAKSVLFNTRARAVFAAFFAREDSFTLGICNGCQMLAALKELVPGAAHWPRFVGNRSEQFEARTSLVELLPSISVLTGDMAGSIIPIAVAHGEGRAEFDSPESLAALTQSAQVVARFVDGRGRIAQRYPENPNGSPSGVAALASEDGRVTIMMPHPERVFRTVLNSWHPSGWGEDGPWLRLFRNARRWVG